MWIKCDKCGFEHEAFGDACKQCGSLYADNEEYQKKHKRQQRVKKARRSSGGGFAEFKTFDTPAREEAPAPWGFWRWLKWPLIALLLWFLWEFVRA